MNTLYPCLRVNSLSSIESEALTRVFEDNDTANDGSQSGPVLQQSLKQV